jgi:outer membrane immunogenic protein
MSKFLTGSMVAIVIAVAVPALGADMAPPYAPAPGPAPVMVYNWTGCYIGGNVGGGWARTDQLAVAQVDGTPAVPPADYGRSEGSAVIGGAQIGCDYQFAGNFVVGVQGMFDFGDIRSTHVLPDFPAFNSVNRTRGVFTVTGRVGYLFAPQVLGYVKGGGAWARIDHSIFGTVPFPFLSESTCVNGVGACDGINRQGWTVGGGLEWMFAPGWSVFGEYNYIDFGRRDIVFVSGPGTVGAADVVSTRLTIQQALVGVNYKFNWGGPVVAKY